MTTKPNSNLTICILLCYLIKHVHSSIQLDGTQQSYAKYPPILLNPPSTISFEFQTIQPNGLLIYIDKFSTQSSDDQSTSDDNFIELKLIESQLRLRFNYGYNSNTQLITLGRSLNDGLWHRVEFKRVNLTYSLLTLDGFISQYRENSLGRGGAIGGLGAIGGGGLDSRHGYNLATQASSVYVGGLPPSYNNKLNLLNLPSVIFEIRFRGSIRNLIYTSLDGLFKSQDVVEWKVRV